MKKEAIERWAYSPREVAKACGKSSAWVYKLIREGELKSVKVRGAVLIPTEELKRFLFVES